MTARIATAYLSDATLQAAANARGENYWDAYLAEISEQLGLCAQPIDLRTLAAPAALAEYSALLIGDLPVQSLSASIRETVSQWVRDGGILLGLGTDGWDELFGNRLQKLIPQPDGPFTLTARFALRSHLLTQDIHSPLQPDQPLLAFAAIRVVTPESSNEVANLVDDVAPGGAVMTVRSFGKGLAFYVGFNVSQTIWVLHKGQPITVDRDNDGFLRTSDMIIIGENSILVQYADELLWLIQNVIGQRRQPFIHQIPPKGGQIPDFLCYWGGDDEAAMNGLQLVASNFLRERNLPYHINVMARSGEFGLSREDCRAILANGHEISLHYNFRDGFQHPYAFTRADVRTQAAAFRETYDVEPICTVNHCTHWSGWHEPAEWYREMGGRADNSFIHHKSPPGNPVNRLGFSFGTAYPHYFYRDAQGGNSRIDFLEEPITGYEIGYTRDETDFPRLHQMLDHAALYHLTLNTFFHPVYVAEYPTCQQAIDEMQRYLAHQDRSVLHLGCDALWRWWDSRHNSRIFDVIAQDAELRFRSDCRSSDGLIAKVPLGEEQAATAQVDGEVTRFQTRREFGQNWAFIVVPSGSHSIRLETQHAPAV